MEKIILPPNYQPPFSLTDNPELNACILDLGYMIYKTNIKYSVLLENTKKNFNIVNLNEDLENKIKQLEERHEKEYQEVLKLERDRNNMLVLQNTNLSSVIASMNQSNKRSTVETGIIGEEIVESWTREIFNSAEIINMSKHTAKGDLHVRLQNKLFLLEIKNKVTIAKSDIDKFIRDIDENKSELHGGLFISLNTPSIPCKGDFSLEYVGSIPIIYIHVSDKQTLKVALKTLLYLNNKSDDTHLTIMINQTYANLKSISTIATSLSKNIDDVRTNLESIKREIKNGISSLEQLFDEYPDLKFEISTTKLDFTEHEIKLLCSVYACNKKAKMDDYTHALGVSAKYLQERGGAIKIKSIVQSIIPSNVLIETKPPPSIILQFDI